MPKVYTDVNYKKYVDIILVKTSHIIHRLRHLHLSNDLATVCRLTVTALKFCWNILRPLSVLLRKKYLDQSARAALETLKSTWF